MEEESERHGVWPFVLMFFAIYGGMNLYLLWKVGGIIPGWGGRMLLAAVVMLLVACPVLIRNLDHAGHFAAARVVAAVGYPWMAIVLWFLCLGVLGDVWNLGVGAVALAAPAAKVLVPPPRAMLAGIALVIVAAGVWGLVEAYYVRWRKFDLPAPQLAPGGNDITLAVISDVHLGVSTRPGQFERLVAMIQQAQPDLVVSLGDLYDSAGHNVDDFGRRLAEIRPPLGKYAIFGNHEFYCGQRESAAFHELAGFKLLRGQAVQVTPKLRLVGVDDPAGYGRRWTSLDDERRLLPEARDSYTILLKHRPDVSDELAGRFDLQLSGHTHGGQFFPFLLITANQFRFYRDLHKLPPGSSVYVSRGAGTWGPPLRLLAAPEVTLFTLRRPD